MKQCPYLWHNYQEESLEVQLFKGICQRTITRITQTFD